MNKPQYHYHFQQKTTEWIRAQISVYFSLSILQPPSSPTTTIHRSWLLCLAHRYFPSSVPDLIFRLKQHKDDDYDDINFVYQLFVDHWNLKYTMNDCIFTFVAMIRQHVTQYNLTTPSNNILAVIRSMPSFKCMQLDFIHMKLFTTTVLHNVTDLDHRMQHIYSHYNANENNTQEEYDDQEKQQYDFLRNCLDRIQAFTQHGEFILHKIGNQTNNTTTTIANSVSALLELDNGSNIQLSNPLRLQLIKPLEKYNQHQYTQRFQQRLQWIKELQQTWIAEYNNVITLIQRRHEKEQDNEKEDDVRAAMNSATLAYQRWSGASPIANTTLYTAMQKQYCEFQKRQDQMTSQKKHVEAFIQYTDDLQEDGRRLLSLVIEEPSSMETLSLAIQSFKDRVYIASERMDARIPYPAHQTLRNGAIQDMVQRKKASLWMLQDDLDHKLRLYQRKQQHQQNTKNIQDDNDLWISMRIKAVQDLFDSAAMPGLTLEDIQQLKKDCRDYRITTLKRKQQSNTKLETLLKQLQNNLDAYERRIRKSNTAKKLSANMQEKTQRIWSILVPIEEGKFDVENAVPKTFSDEAASLDDTDLLLSEAESDAEYTWIRRQHQDFVSLINYGNALLAQRTTCQSYQSKVKELLAVGTRHCHTLESTWNNLARSNYNRHHHQHTNLLLYDDYVKQSDTFLLQVNRQNLLPLFPCKNVQANRISPYIPENTFLGWLSRQCTALTELNSTVSLLVQKCRYLLDIKSSMESCLNNISTCTPNDEVYEEQKKEVKVVRARILNAPGCDAIVEYWDQVSLDALSCFEDQIRKHKQAEQQRMADIAAEGMFTSWRKTVVDFETAVPDDNDQLTHTLVEQLEALYQINKISFGKILYVFSAAGRPLTTKMHQEQQRVTSTLQDINTKYQNQKVMAKYNDLHTAWQQNMDAALQLCDEQEASVTTLIHNSKMLVTLHSNKNKENNNDQALLLLPPTPPPAVATLPKVPDIENLRHHVAQHSLHHLVGFDQVLDSQLMLDKRIHNLNDTTKYAANIQVQCSKIKRIIDDLMYLKNNDDASIMQNIAKQINNPELYPARGSSPDDIEFNKSIRNTLESLFNDALNQQQIRAETSKQRKIHEASNSIIKEFQKKADDVLTSNPTQKTVDELTLSAHNCIVHINRQFIGINSDDNSNRKYQDSIESILATVRRSWEQQSLNVVQKEKQQRNQILMDEYRALYNWLTEQHNSIQIADVDNDSKVVTEQRNILQQLERNGIDALCVLYQNEKKQQETDSTHVQEMRVLFERAKGDHKDLVAALNYGDELSNKKQLEKSRQSYANGLLSTMRVMMTWAQQNQEFTVTCNTSRQDMDRIEYKASKALYLFKAQAHVYPEYQELQLQYQQTRTALEEVICAARSAKPYCDMHIELDEIEASIRLVPTSVLDTMLNDIAHQVDEAVMDSSEKLNREQVRNRYDELVKLVDLIKTEKEKEKQQSEEIEAQKEASRQRLAIEQAIQAAKKDTLAVGAVVDNDDSSTIHEFYLSGISTLSIHQARRIKWYNDELNEAVCDLEGSYACLHRVAQHAKQTQDIMTWIKKWEGQDITETASAVEKFLEDNVSDEAPSIIKSSVELATARRRTNVQEAWNALCVQMKHAEAMAAQRLKEQHEQEQLATVEWLIKRAKTQLSHCRWEVNKKDLVSMPREPEALAIERRVTDLSATTANLLREHYPNNIQTDENEAYRAIVDTSIRQFFDTVQDTQCKIAQALAISEYLMISDDIHMMISIFEESLPKASIRNISKQDLQAIEAQQKYYDEHIEQELETAQEIAVDNPMLNKPYKQLCDRWASVKRHVQSLLRRGRVTRGRLTSLPILPAFNTSTTNNTVITYTTNNTTASSLTSTSNIDNNYNCNPSPLVSASSPLSPRPVNSISNINKKKRLIYEPDPENQLDVEIGKIVNQVPYSVKVEMVPGEVGRYWFGSRLVYCRILKSRMVMLRVGGGWCELSQFMRDHAMLHDTNDIHIVSDEQGFIQMNTTRRPSLPPPLYHSSSSSTISTTSTSSSGYYMDGDRYMAVDHYGNHHTLKMKKVDGLLNSSGSRSILIK